LYDEGNVLKFFSDLFATDFVPHGYCMRWASSVVWLHVASDAIIALAYFVIPIALILFVRKRKDLAFHWMFVAFGIFILACGTTHVFSIITLWYPVYRIEGVIKAVTALSSIVTAVLLVKMIPVALRLPSPDDLRREIELRKGAEQDLRNANAGLEQRVQERTARMERYNKALQSIAYISSHDLTEPVRTISLFTEELQSSAAGKLHGSELEYLGFIVTNARRMLHLIEDLSGFTHAVRSTEEATAFFPEHTPINVALKAALEDLRGALEESSASVIYSEDLPEVAMNRMPLQAVLKNLMANSIKYARTGVPMRIDVSATEENHAHVISVRDNGLGLDMAYADVIFQPFKRLHGAEIPGSGVGLAICKNVVESFGGRIWVESEGPGTGASFHFSIPR
jgi:signal transduction histidine kinase